MAVVKIPKRRVSTGAFIGRGVRVTIGEIDVSGLEPTVELLIEAPRSIAVSRDDEGIGRHVRRQHALDEAAKAREEADNARAAD